MIVLLSNGNDKTTIQVISYILKMNRDFILLEDNPKEQKYSDVEIINLLISAQSIWLRSGDFFNIGFFSQKLAKEQIIYKDYLHFLAERNKKCLGSLMREFTHNKLIDLEIAKRFKLSIPKTFIINDSKALSEIISKYPKLNFLTKALWNHNIFTLNNNAYVGGAPQLIDPLDLDDNITYSFLPSLVQEVIKKNYEIRIFYLNGDFYSMAIFSQKDNKTKLDYRNYNRDLPNRNVPFKLPEAIKKKLTLLMKSLNLNTGSIDMIYSVDNEFIFLEVNPVGQFGWLSENCNYYLEKIIALKLCN